MFVSNYSDGEWWEGVTHNDWCWACVYFNVHMNNFERELIESTI